MDIFQAIILGIVEGISEFLPISSTGHLILTAKLLGLNGEFTKSFEIAIQSGAILAVALLYGKTLISNIDLLKKILVAFVPTGIIGFLLYKVIKSLLIGNYYVTLASLFIGGFILIIVELYFKKKKSNNSLEKLTYKNALIIGLIQSISIIPGVSRSAATIIGGLFLGLNRTAAVEFSFLLAIPTLLAATSYDLLKNYKAFSSSEFVLLGVGFPTSAVVALLVIKWFIKYIKRYSFISFGIYRILIALAFFFLFIRD